jgi:hypothetical protein
MRRASTFTPSRAEYDPSSPVCNRAGLARNLSRRSCWPSLAPSPTAHHRRVRSRPCPPHVNPRQPILALELIPRVPRPPSPRHAACIGARKGMRSCAPGKRRAAASRPASGTCIASSHPPPAQPSGRTCIACGAAQGRGSGSRGPLLRCPRASARSGVASGGVSRRHVR